MTPVDEPQVPTNAASGHVLVDGEPSDSVPANDRGLAYADGVFRTLVVDKGQPVAWSAQYRRLAMDCAALSLEAPAVSALRADIESLFGGAGDGVVRMTVTRAGGGRGYTPPAEAHSRRIVIASPPPASVPESLALDYSSIELAVQPALAGIKHLARLEQVLARDACQRSDRADAAMCDTEGRVISTTMRNLLFVDEHGRVATPKLSRAGIAGATRARVMSAMAEAGESVTEIDIEPADLPDYVGAIATNSVVGTCAVERVGSCVLTQSHAFAERARAALLTSAGD